MQNRFKQQHLTHHWEGKDFPNNSANLPKCCIIALNAHTQADSPPAVFVAVSEMGDCLQLSYFIEKQSWLNLDNFHIKNYERQDYLWENHCLECFLELSGDTAYLETNVSPSGAYNLYHFNDYRTPDTMPPVQDKLAMLLIQENLNELDNWHQYHISIKLDEYRAFYAHQSNRICQITKINPCVILYQDNQPIYYAKNHANPPDFHNKQFWMDFSKP